MSMSQIYPDLLFIIAEQYYGPNLLRRHIVTDLRRMHLMRIEQDHPTIQYITDEHDNGIRRRCAFDHQERVYYAALRSTLQLFTPGPAIHRLVAERDWLRRPPMDYTEFRHFCDNPQDIQYRDRDYIAIELFPEAEFIHPNAALAGLDAADRVVLANRAGAVANAGHGLHIMALDTKVYTGLSGLWLANLRSMPSWVRKVKVIVKKSSPGFVGLNVLMANEVALISRELTRMEQIGTFEYRGMLWVNTRVME
ncbi:hypothetical protein LTR56_014155 [Elasticomyces elasticus]|nr:hypothetical protein LTR56_014155 [Elasticomyces elasticus]KAK3662763.1 hypothetical protein LTR22_006379 [Elasticomyces elasticus]KAK4918013.1 hypothetical protein LTR49_014151 [Elasticomyces elasticus]KAK5754489.1 hypothetical protein LTS12_015444 [Elasticomyces elasticus]